MDSFFTLKEAYKKYDDEWFFILSSSFEEIFCDLEWEVVEL